MTRRRRRRHALHDKQWYASLFSLTLVTLVAAGTVFTAANTVPSSRVEDDNRAVTVDDKKPPECAGITLTNLVTGSGIINGTAANDLIIGSSGADTINGRNGNDCIIGGGGNDDITGAAGTDVCLGGLGVDTFAACETQFQ